MTTTTTPTTTAVRRTGDRRKTRTVVPVQPSSAEQQPAPAPPTAPRTAPLTGDWATYPGVRYALERLDARRHPAADGGPDAA
jgi:hypothetical protein